MIRSHCVGSSGGRGFRDAKFMDFLASGLGW
jgi:hypothetical protein